MNFKSYCLMLVGFVATAAHAENFNYSFEQFSGPTTYAASSGPLSVLEEYATFGNGVVLTNPTNFPIFDSNFKSDTNKSVYGTSDLGGSLFSNIISINISQDYIADLISFTLFNGMTDKESYTVNAYGADHNFLSKEKSGNLDGNFTKDTTTDIVGGASFTKISFDNSKGNIYFIEIVSDKTSNSSNNLKSWDFLIDDVSFDGVSIAESVPEPETYAMMLAGLGLMGLIGRRRRAI